MTIECAPELELLLSGKKNSIEIKGENLCRDSILEELNNLIMNFFPGAWTKGKFVNEDKDYLVYDIDLKGPNVFTSSIRFLDFGDKFLLIKV